MNDRHPSGTAQYAAYDGHSTTSFATDPLFGDLPGDVPYDPSAHESSSYNTGSYHSGSYDTGQWPTQATGTPQPYTTSPYPTASYETGSYDTGAYETGAYDTTAMWATGVAGHDQQQTGQWPAQAYDTGSFEAQPHETQTFEPHAFEPHAAAPQPFETQPFATQPFETHSFEAPVFGTTAYDTGAYDATAWNSAGHADHPQAHEASEAIQAPNAVAAPDVYADADASADAEADADATADPGHDSAPQPEPVTRAAARRTAQARTAQTRTAKNRSRRRTPAKRSALLTVAVPSVCVVGVAGAAAASVGTFSGDEGKETQSMAAPDASAVQPSVANNKLDTQLKEMSADAGDFADRASRTQERIDLKAKQEADRKKAAAAAAHKEAMRPKFVLPVKQHGLSAYYGQAGINWMSVHSGIDFPVSYGTEVMAATDGTVRTQWNSAYGNMAIVTAKDGTETWYCHLSSHTVMSGPVKAGDVIAHSGNSGNSTGPHMHFEVRPGGGAAIDPLPWLRGHDLDPT